MGDGKLMSVFQTGAPGLPRRIKPTEPPATTTEAVSSGGSPAAKTFSAFTDPSRQIKSYLAVVKNTVGTTSASGTGLGAYTFSGSADGDSFTLELHARDGANKVIATANHCVDVAGGSADQYLRPSAGTEIESSGKITTGASPEEIVMRIDSGQGAGSGGIDGMIGAMYWSLGSSLTGPVCIDFDWVQKINLSNVVIALYRSASAPTSLADVDGASSHFLQIRVSGAGGVSTFLKTGTSSLATTNAENKASSVSIAYQCAVDEKGLGPTLSRHYFTATGTQGRTLASTSNSTSGNLYVVLCFSKAGTASGDEDIKVKLRGGMPV